MQFLLDTFSVLVHIVHHPRHDPVTIASRFINMQPFFLSLFSLFAHFLCLLLPLTLFLLVLFGDGGLHS
jgi:hypothetical protein